MAAAAVSMRLPAGAVPLIDSVDDGDGDKPILNYYDNRLVQSTVSRARAARPGQGGAPERNPLGRVPAPAGGADAVVAAPVCASARLG